MLLYIGCMTDYKIGQVKRRQLRENSFQFSGILNFYPLQTRYTNVQVSRKGQRTDKPSKILSSTTGWQNESTSKTTAFKYSNVKLLYLNSPK